MTIRHTNKIILIFADLGRAWFFNRREITRLWKGKPRSKPPAWKAAERFALKARSSLPQRLPLCPHKPGSPSTARPLLRPRCTPATCPHGHSSPSAGNALRVASVVTEPRVPCTYCCISRHKFIRTFYHIPPGRHASQWVFMGSSHFSEADKVNQNSPI